MRCRIVVALAAVAAVVFVGSPASAAPPASPWLQPGYNAANSRFNPNESTVSSSTVTKLVTRYTVTASDSDDADACAASVAEPAISESHLYTVVNQTLYAYDLTTGRTLWSTRLAPDGVTKYSDVSVSHGLVIVGGDDCGTQDPNGTVQAYASSDGHYVWAATRPAESFFALVVFDKYVVVQWGCGECNDSSETWVYRIANGSVAWRTPTARAAYTTYAGKSVVDGLTFAREYVNSATRISAYLAYNGAYRWSRADYYRVIAGDTDAATANNLIAIGDPGVADLNPRTGAVRFLLQGAKPNQDFPSAALDASRIYLQCGDAQDAVCAYSNRTGALVWKVSVPGRIDQPSVANGLLYLGNGQVRDAATGALVTTLSGPAVAIGSGHVVTAADKNYLYPFGLTALRVLSP